MKKALLFFAGILILASCAKQDPNQEPTDKWNGYFSYYKDGPVSRDLLAGQYINIGTVEYGLNSDAELYVTYNLTGGWVMTESHVLATGCLTCYTNKPGNPKVGRFPYAANHDPAVTTYTYTIPLVDLPPAENPGFVVAAHCVAVNPDGGNETAWANCDNAFTDKEWGWYDIINFYDLDDHSVEVIYGIEQTEDALNIYQVDVTNGTAELIYTEVIDGTNGIYDGAAYDPVNDNLFFVDEVTNDLYVVDMTNESDPVVVGTLTGDPEGATFDDGSYWYVNEELNTINRVSFNEDWTISSITVMSTIPNTVTINDIAMSPSGTNLYIVGTVEDGTTELLTWDVAANTYFSLDIALNDGAQIAYTDSGDLYAVQENVLSGETEAYYIDAANAILTPVKDGTVIIDDPFSRFSDLSSGRTL